MYVVLDTETSGLFDFSRPAEADGQPRMAAIAMIFVDDDLRELSHYDVLVQPDGWEMSAEAAAVTGLTMERLAEEGRPIAEILDRYTDAVNVGNAFIAHNSQFDLKQCRGELRRAGRPDLFEKTPNLCTMRAATGVCRLPKARGGGYKFPKVAEAYQHFYKRPIEGAHTALGDARACLEIARFLKRINCLPEPMVHRAKEGTKAGEALRARREAESTEETMPSTHMSDG